MLPSVSGGLGGPALLAALWCRTEFVAIVKPLANHDCA